MKKKFLMFLLMLCCILPCFFFVTACSEPDHQGQNQGSSQEQNPSSGNGQGSNNGQGQNPGSNQGQNPSGSQNPSAGQGEDASDDKQDEVNYSILIDDENYILSGYVITQVEVDNFDYDAILSGPDLREGNEYAVWVDDFYKVNDVQIYFDNEPLTMTYFQTNNQNSRIITTNKRREAKFTLPDNLSGEHNIKCETHEEEYVVKFISDGQSFTDEEKEVLSNYCLPSIEGKDFLTLMDSGESFVVKYSDFPKGILFTSKKTVGWYSHSIFAIPQTYSHSYNIYYSYAGGENKNGIFIDIDVFSGFPCDGGEQSILELTFNKEQLVPSMLGVESQDNSNPHLGQILSLSNVSTYWSSAKETATKAYIEPYEGVNLDNVEAYIFDVKMEIKTDAENGKKYFEIPAGKVPFDYFSSETSMSLEYYKCTNFHIRLENVDVSDSDLLTVFTVSSNNDSIQCNDPLWMDFYCRINGVTYFKPGSTVAEFYRLDGTSLLPSSIKMNGESLDLTNYVVFDSSVPVGNETDGHQSWRYENSGFWFVYHKVKIGTKDVLLTLYFKGESKKLEALIVNFDISVNTNVELIY